MAYTFEYTIIYNLAYDVTTTPLWHLRRAPNSVWTSEVMSNRMGVEKFVMTTRLTPLSSHSGLIGCG